MNATEAASRNCIVYSIPVFFPVLRFPFTVCLKIFFLFPVRKPEVVS
jgi:hypothetical protein